jgi:hypothetical protein
MIIREGKFITLHKAEWFERADFIAWLNHPDTKEVVWHTKSKLPNSDLDIILYYEGGTGSFDFNSDIFPDDIRYHLYKAVENYDECLVWLQNV